MIRSNELQSINFDQDLIEEQGGSMTVWDHIGTFMYAGTVEKRAEREAIMSDDSFIGYEKNPWEEDEIAIFVELASELMPRMEKGQRMMDRVMKRINMLQGKLDQAKRGKRIPKTEWDAIVELKSQAWDEWNHLLAHKRKLNDQLRNCSGNMAACWAAWYNKFNEDLDEAVEWLEDEYLNPDFYQDAGKAIDEQDALNATQADTIEVLAETHIEEMREYEKNVDPERVFLPSSWYNVYEACLLHRRAFRKG